MAEKKNDRKRVVVIDNYDSFTYNIVQYIGEYTGNITVLNNDETSVKDITKLRPTHIVVSPGPSWPKNAGISMEVIKYFAGKVPLFGVCLGHECMVEAFGGKIRVNKRIMHGKVSKVYHDGKGVYKGVPNPFIATRYHSLVADGRKLPRDFKVAAKTKQGEIMGIRHVKYSIEGVQFHPESILTESGKKIIKNFLDMGMKK